MKSIDKNLDLTKYKCSDGAYVNIATESIKINGKDGTWPEVEFFWDGDIKEYNCIKFYIKVNGFSNVTLIFHNDQARAIFDAARARRRREFPNDTWEEVTWFFRDRQGWVTPLSATGFDFDKAFSFGLCLDGTETSEHSYVEIKNILFSNQKNTIDKICDPLFDKFVEEHIHGTTQQKKVLIWANSKIGERYSASIESVVNNIEQYKLYKNVNGLIMRIIDGTSPIFSDTFFTPDKLNTEVIDNAIELYKKTDWGQFTDNFFLFNIAGMAAKRFNIDGKTQALDWFDDDLFYNHIFPKIAYLCKALKSIGAQICFDNEAYSTEPYDYYYKYRNTGRSFFEYEEKVRQRGREFAETVNKNYPSAKVLMLFGPWVGKGIELPKDEARYGLMQAFYDGICQAKTSVSFIDGYEGGYEFTNYRSVLKGLYVSKNCKNYSVDPSAYEKTIKNDFGIWVRPNMMTKEGFASVLVNSLKECNEYVWIYTQDWAIENEQTLEYINAACEQVEKEKGV